MRKLITSLLCVLIPPLLLLAMNAEAQTLGRIDGTRALATFQEPVQVGDQFFVLSADGKKTAIVQVEKTQGNRAIVNLLKGKWQTGNTLSFRKSAPDEAQFKVSSKTNWAAGIYFGYGTDSFSIKAKGGGLEVPITMSGNTFSILSVLDRNLTDQFTLRGKAGLDGFNVATKVDSENQAVCNDTTDCRIQFVYMGLDGQILWKLTSGPNFRPYLLVGYNFLLASSGKTTVTNFDSTVKTNSSLDAGLGLEVAVGKSGFVPVEVIYKMYQVSSDIKASTLMIGTGYMFKF